MRLDSLLEGQSPSSSCPGSALSSVSSSTSGTAAVDGGTASLSLLGGWKLFMVSGEVCGFVGSDGNLRDTTLCLKLTWLAAAFEGTSAGCSFSGCRGV